MLAWTDSQILAEADKWRWTPSGTREHKFDRFVLSIYPEGWNRNFVELDHSASADANVFAQVVAASRELAIVQITWRVVEAPETAEFEGLLLRNGYVVSESSELLAWEMGCSERPILPEISAEFGLGPVLVDNFESFRAETSVRCRTFGLPVPSHEEAKVEWTTANAVKTREKYASFLVYIGEMPVATAGLTMAERVVRLWGAATVPEYRGRGAYKILVRARLHEGHARGAELGIVNARTGTSGPILRRIGFHEVAMIREYTGSV